MYGSACRQVHIVAETTSGEISLTLRKRGSVDGGKGAVFQMFSREVCNRACKSSLCSGGIPCYKKVLGSEIRLVAWELSGEICVRG